MATNPTEKQIDDFIAEHAAIGMHDGLVSKALKRQLGVAMTHAQVQRRRVKDGRVPRYHERSQRTGMSQRQAYIPDHERLIRWLWVRCGWDAAEIAKRLDKDGIRAGCTASAVRGLMRRRGWEQGKTRRKPKNDKLKTFSQLVISYGCTDKEHELFGHAGVVVPGWNSAQKRKARATEKAARTKRKRKKRTKRSAEPKRPTSIEPQFEVSTAAPGITVHARREMIVELSPEAVRNAVTDAISGAVRFGTELTFTNVSIRWDKRTNTLAGATVSVEVESKDEEYDE